MTHQMMHLVVVIEQESFSRAAKELNVTQPALSRSIRYLEDEVGGKLLNRGREGASPTKLGKQLYIHGKNILASLDRAAADVKAWHRHDLGHIMLGSSALPAVYFVPDAIASFLAQHPKVGLRYDVHPTKELLTMLRQGSIDLFVGGMAFDKPPEGISSTILLEDRFAIISGPQHPLATRKKWKISELEDYPWILPSGDAALRQQAEAAFVEFGLSNVEIAVETMATTALVPLMHQGNYLTLHSQYLLSPEIQSKNLVVLSADVPSSRRSLAAFHRPVEETTELVGAFIEHLKDFAKLTEPDRAKAAKLKS